MKKSRILLLAFSALLIVVIISALKTPQIESHQNKVVVNAPKDIAWSVISDVSNYDRYAQGLTDVHIVAGEGKGMVRSCSDPTGTWTETCTAWEEGKLYSFNVDVESGFPYPFKTFRGTWSVEETSSTSSVIVVDFEYQFPQNWMAWFYNEDTHALIDEGNADLLANWTNHILKKYTASLQNTSLTR